MDKGAKSIIREPFVNTNSPRKWKLYRPGANWRPGNNAGGIKKSGPPDAAPHPWVASV